MRDSRSFVISQLKTNKAPNFCLNRLRIVSPLFYTSFHSASHSPCSSTSLPQHEMTLCYGKSKAYVILLLSITCSAVAAAATDVAGIEHQAANNSSTSGTVTTHHKALAPIYGSDVALFVVVAVALFIASGAGVGGGVLVVPSLLVISQFGAIAAVALSNVTILASSVANLGFNLPRHGVLGLGPLIDWDLVLLFGPPTVVGSIAGSYVNMVTPSWVTKICLFILLIPMAWRMLDKACSLFKHESTAKKATAAKSFEADDLTAAASVVETHKASKAEQACTGVTCVPVQADSCSQSQAFSAPAAPALQPPTATNHVAEQFADVEAGSGPSSASCAVDNVPAAAACKRARRVLWHWPSSDSDLADSDSATQQAVRDRLLREQAQMLPPFQVGLLVFILVDVAVASLLAGYLLPCGSWQYWLLVLSPLLVMLMVWAAARRHVLWKASWRAALQFSDAGSIKWNTHSTTVYPAICISAGVIAGMLGLGGGLVLAPLMLELGVNPAVSAASTQVTLLISSSTSAIVYAVNGAVPWDYGIVLVIIGFLATLSGQWLVSWLVRKLGRPSILVITLAAMFCAATLAAAAVVVITALDLSRHPEKWVARKGVCQVA